MFSLIYSCLMAYTIHKGNGPTGPIGGLITVMIICDLVALNIIFG